MSAKLSVRRLVSVVGALVISVTTLTVAQQPPPQTPPPPLPSAGLFNDAVVQRIDLRLHSSDWEKLKENFQENKYYPADLAWNGQTVSIIGIRSRGLGSRSRTKPGLRVDFDYYSPERAFLGLKSIVLDNLTQDASAIHETVTMKLFARLGIPAPREAHARLYINNHYVGLYAIVESIDKQFLARVFGSIGGDTQNDGYLYEFDYVDPWTFSYLGSRLEAYAERFKSKTHDKKSMVEKFGPIETLVRLVNELPTEQFRSGIDQHLDLAAFMRYVAAQTFVAQNDGFLGYAGMNNFYFYRLENSTRHVFLAWDEDNAFWGHDYPIETRHDENVLMRKAMQVSELRDMYYGMLNEAMASADEPTGPGKPSWLEVEIRRQSELIYDALREDPFKPYSLEAHDDARNAMIEFAQQRSHHLRGQLAAR